MKNSVYKNASIVTGLSVAERCLGFLYRIVLSRYIGAEGLGLYQVSLSVFSLFLTLATGGIPITVSRLIAKHKAERNEKGEGEVVSAGTVGSLLFALPCCLLLWTLGNSLSFLFSDSRSLSIFRILLIGLSFSCVYAVIRGYFWGNKKFLTASLLEMTEEIVMVIAGVLLLRNVPSPAVGATRAAWALALSDIVACLIAVVCFFLLGGKLGKPKKQLKPLFNATLPITFVRASTALVNSAVAVLLPVMLVRSGVDERDALRLFGIVSGMVVPVLFIPSTLIGSLALVLVPELSADYHKREEKRLTKNLERGLTLSFLVACLLIPFFFVLGEDLGRLAFSNGTAGKIIARGCVILLPMSLTMISTSMLNSIGFERQTFLFFFLGAAALLLCILLLPAICGVYAYVFGLGASFFVTTVCNLVLLGKKCPLLRSRAKELLLGVVLPALLAILPLTLAGELLHAALGRVLGGVLQTVFSAVGMGLLVATFFLLFRKKAKPPFVRKNSKNDGF